MHSKVVVCVCWTTKKSATKHTHITYKCRYDDEYVWLLVYKGHKRGPKRNRMSDNHQNGSRAHTHTHSHTGHTTYRFNVRKLILRKVNPSGHQRNARLECSHTFQLCARKDTHPRRRAGDELVMEKKCNSRWALVVVALAVHVHGWTQNSRLLFPLWPQKHRFEIKHLHLCTPIGGSSSECLRMWRISVWGSQQLSCVCVFSRIIRITGHCSKLMHSCQVSSLNTRREPPHTHTHLATEILQPHHTILPRRGTSSEQSNASEWTNERVHHTKPHRSTQPTARGKHFQTAKEREQHTRRAERDTLLMRVRRRRPTRKLRNEIQKHDAQTRCVKLCAVCCSYTILGRAYVWYMYTCG